MSARSGDGFQLKTLAQTGCELGADDERLGHRVVPKADLHEFLNPSLERLALVLTNAPAVPPNPCNPGSIEPVVDRLRGDALTCSDRVGRFAG